MVYAASFGVKAERCSEYSFLYHDGYTERKKGGGKGVLIRYSEPRKYAN
jgi:hypothetical protein